VPVISLSLGYPDGGCPDAEDILPVITPESKLSTGRFPEPACAWSFYTLLASHVRLCLAPTSPASVGGSRTGQSPASRKISGRQAVPLQLVGLALPGVAYNVTLLCQHLTYVLLSW